MDSPYCSFKSSLGLNRERIFRTTIGLMTKGCADDWFPFKSSDDDSIPDSGDDSDDEDGISDTWQQFDMGLEDGEIDPAVDSFSKSPDNPAAVPTVETTEPIEVEPTSRKLDSLIGNKTVAPDSNDGINYKYIPTPVPDNSRTGSPVCSTLPGPNPSKPISNSVAKDLASSPEFEFGDSNVKRRRTKKKNKGDDSLYHTNIPPPVSPGQRDDNSSQVPSSSPSIDLNRCVNAPRSSSQNVEPSGSPSHSMSASSRELDHTADIGIQLGFQIDRSNPALVEAINGGGVKKVP
ncbi:hypothetical protein L2E82_20491 [Cichorium intybus]|uniref:Uncharacterized protein n=1 Tax=Cichorium intybus TaxID=13427 RepID=A0ACB9DT33_CICIN|nr:hypothetical protein L2E82_20491 [Cichorium intybus]